jgi:8-oxo-dGTP diphosphatase
MAWRTPPDAMDQSMTQKKSIRVVAALLRSPTDKMSYLIQQRLPKGDRSNLWEFPGGKVEIGESDEQALIRECREELEVEISLKKFLCEVTHEYADLIVHLRLFLAQVETGIPKALSAQAVQFATISQMKKLPFCEADIPLLIELEHLL